MHQYTEATSPEVKRNEAGEVVGYLAGVDDEGFAIYVLYFDLV